VWRDDDLVVVVLVAWRLEGACVCVCLCSFANSVCCMCVLCRVQGWDGSKRRIYRCGQRRTVNVGANVWCVDVCMHTCSQVSQVVCIWAHRCVCVCVCVLVEKGGAGLSDMSDS